MNNFISEIWFLTKFLSKPIDKFYQTIQNTFFMKKFPITKKNTRKTVFLFLVLALCNPTGNNVIQNSFLRKHLLFIFSSGFILFLSSCSCTPTDESYQTNQLFSRKTKITEKNFFSKIYIFFYHRFSVLPLIKLLVEKIYEKCFSLQLISPERKSFFNIPVQPHW